MTSHGPERRRALERLALQELRRAELEVAHAHVVEHGVAGDRRLGLLRGRRAAPAGRSRPSARPPSRPVRHARQHDVVVRPDQCRRELGEDRRVVGQLVAHLQDVVAVVLPDADDLLRRGHEWRVVQRCRAGATGRRRPRACSAQSGRSSSARTSASPVSTAPFASTRTARLPVAVRIVASLIKSPHRSSRRAVSSNRVRGTRSGAVRCRIRLP